MNENVIEHKSKQFKVGNIAKKIIEKLNSGKSVALISEELNNEYNTSYFNVYIIDDFILKNNLNSMYSNTIRFQKIIFKPYKHYKVLKKLSFLYNKSIVISLISLFVILNIFLLTQTYFFNFSKVKDSFNITDYLLIYIALFLVMLIHEYGHVIASIKNRVIPKSIGFGIYFIFPVLYTDLTKIWKLKKNERILINLGGVYFQMITVIFLFILWIIFENKFTQYLIYINFLIMITVFNPFFKYDGYWIYSDYFNIKNLRYKSSQYLKDLISKNKNKATIPLKIYSILMSFFFIFQIYLLIKFTIHNISLLTGINNLSSELDIVYFIINSILNILFISIILQRIIKYIKK